MFWLYLVSAMKKELCSVICNNIEKGWQFMIDGTTANLIVLISLLLSDLYISLSKKGIAKCLAT